MGTFYFQNYRRWSDENLNFTIECKSQYSFQINVRCGILNDRIRHLFTVLKTSDRKLYPQYAPRKKNSAWFQKHGVAIHSTVKAKNYLIQLFYRKFFGIS